MGIHVELASLSARVTDTHWSLGGVCSRAWQAVPLDDLSAQVSCWHLQSLLLWGCLVSKIPPTTAFHLQSCGVGVRPVKLATLPVNTLPAPCCPDLSCMCGLFCVILPG